MTAIASVLHSFYNGLENIFKTIAKSQDQVIPPGQGWHRQLLLRLAQSVGEGKPVLSQDLVSRLVEYLGFRHFFRHSYSTFLDWGKLEELVGPLPEVWSQTRLEIEAFLKRISGGRSEAN